MMDILKKIWKAIRTGGIWIEDVWTRIRLRRCAPSDAPTPLLEEIQEVHTRLCCVQRRFDQLSDGDLLEACIYEMEALQAQYRFLLRQAKAQGLQKSPFPHAPL